MIYMIALGGRKSPMPPEMEIYMQPEKESRQNPQSRFVLEGNALYEIDEECMKRKAQSRDSRPKKRKRNRPGN